MNEINILGINAGRRLGVEPLLSAKDMVNQNVEHLGVMAYAASFQWIPPRTHPSAVVTASSESHTTRVYQPVCFLYVLRMVAFRYNKTFIFTILEVIFFYL